VTLQKAAHRTPHAIVAMGTTDRLARLGFPFTRPCVIKKDQTLYCTSVWKSWFHGIDHAVLISERIAVTQMATQANGLANGYLAQFAHFLHRKWPN
jgi:hypothetical protein